MARPKKNTLLDSVLMEAGLKEERETRPLDETVEEVAETPAEVPAETPAEAPAEPEEVIIPEDKLAGLNDAQKSLYEKRMAEHAKKKEMEDSEEAARQKYTLTPVSPNPKLQEPTIGGLDKEFEPIVPPVVETTPSTPSIVSAGSKAESIRDLPLTDEEKDKLLQSRLRAILGKPKDKKAVPSLVRFRQGGQAPLRAVIIDIGENELREGWEFWKQNATVGWKDPEKYLLQVYELTQSEIPRMYRTVSELRLE